MDTKITPSSGNVFRDLGFGEDEAEHLRVRSTLMIAVRKLIEERSLTQAQAAKHDAQRMLCRQWPQPLQESR